MCGRDRSLFHQEDLWLVCLRHLSEFPLESSRPLGEGMPRHQLTQHLTPSILAFSESLECCPWQPYPWEFRRMLIPWHMPSFVIIIVPFVCLRNVLLKYHLNCIISLLACIFSISHLNPLNLDSWWKYNFSRLNSVHKIDSWGNFFQFKFQTPVRVFNFRKFPKIIFFLHNF